MKNEPWLWLAPGIYLWFDGGYRILESRVSFSSSGSFWKYVWWKKCARNHPLFRLVLVEYIWMIAYHGHQGGRANFYGGLVWKTCICRPNCLDSSPPEHFENNPSQERGEAWFNLNRRCLRLTCIDAYYNTDSTMHVLPTELSSFISSWRIPSCHGRLLRMYPLFF